MTNTFDPQTATIVVVTFNRSELLTKCLNSILKMDPAPGRVVVIDNASSDNTQEVMSGFQQQFGERLVYRRLDTNTGGSGGFSAGMETAYDIGSEWIWLMDDDVEVLEDGLSNMGKWTDRFKSIQGRRYDFDGSVFYWQYKQSIPLGIPIPFAPADFGEQGYQPMNSGCFEGMFVHRSIVKQVGLPDPRFFIYWDDALYGWLISRLTESVAVSDIVLRRTRELKQLDLGTRHLNGSSDFYRYYIMRNRGFLVQYFRTHKAHRSIRFGLGTMLTFGKEYIRLFLVEKKFKGSSNLWRGWRDGRKVMRDKSWQPMPVLEN
ncbi:MAG: glycosyltransferase [Microbacteriaceae bacterium]